MAVSKNKIYTIAGYAGGSYYLNRWGSGSVSNHQNVTLYSKTPDPDQQWYMQSVTGGYQILSMLNKAYGLNIYPPQSNNCDLYPVSGNANDATVVLQEVSGKANVYRIKLANYNLYLTAASNSSGANVYWAASNNATSQQWKFTEVSSSGGGDEPGGTSKKITLPLGRNCNWNQFCPGITNITGNIGCALTCGLDVANFYGPSSYKPSDMKNFWNGGYTWGLPSGCAGAIQGYSSTNDTDSKRLEIIRTEINGNRPVIIRLASANASDTHYVVAYGYQNGGKTKDDILVFDPATKSGDTSEKGRDTTLSNAITFSKKTRITGLKLTYKK